MLQTISFKDRSAIVDIADRKEHQQKYWQGGMFYETQRHGLLNHIALKHRECVFIDVGASIGNHTLFFAKVCGAKKVLSIEPYLPSFLHLQKHIALNGLEEIVTAVNCAVGNNEGVVSVNRYGNSDNIGMVKIIPDAPDEGFQVRYNTLDSIIAESQFPKVDVIKIDVEHHNIEVLQGMEYILMNDRPVIYIEAESNQQFADVSEFLKRFRYRYHGGKFNHTPTYEFIPE